jgi:hypothetical protein
MVKGAADAFVSKIIDFSDPLPSLTSLVPSIVRQGSTIDLLLNGANFFNGSTTISAGPDISVSNVVVYSISFAQARFMIAPSATPGLHMVTVTTPAGTSKGISLAVQGTGTNPLPSLTSLSTTSVTTGGPGFILTVNGNNFVVGSAVQWNGITRGNTFVSSTQLQASILAGDIATAVTAEVTVSNPEPTGVAGVSNPLFVAVQDRPARAGTFGHFAAGGGWKTTFTLVNSSDQNVTFRLSFYSDTGAPLTLPLILPDGSRANNSLADWTIPGRGTVLVSTDAPASAPVVAGWADVHASGQLAGYAIFQQGTPGVADSEGTSLLETTAASSFVFAYDNTGGFQTAAAIVNTASSPATVTVVVRDDTGKQIDSSQLSLVSLGHMSFFINTQFATTANRRGTIEFQAPTGGLTGLGLHFSPTLSFTSIPIIR